MRRIGEIRAARRSRVGRRLDGDELIEHWTLVGQELEQVAGKRGPSRLGFALLLRFHTLHGRFPRGRHELPDEAIAYVATLVKVPAADLGFYEWQGRTWEYHRAQIRTFRGFRECTVADADKLTAWLAEYVCQSERRPERVREQLLGQLSTERIEPPTPARITRIIGSALRTAEQALTSRVSAQIPAAVAARMHALIAEASDDPAAVRRFSGRLSPHRCCWRCWCCAPPPPGSFWSAGTGAAPGSRYLLALADLPAQALPAPEPGYPGRLRCLQQDQQLVVCAVGMELRGGRKQRRPQLRIDQGRDLVGQGFK